MHHVGSGAEQVCLLSGECPSKSGAALFGENFIRHFFLFAGLVPLNNAD